MDYRKIYDQFVASRKHKTPSGYYEVHHIVPRAFGGSDEPENLIKLTASDHFFAHVLLAKIYGGPMIPAVFLMSNRRWHGRPKKQFRLVYASMRKEWAEYAATLPAKKGSDNGNYNSERFEWLNLDTLETLHATLHEMWCKFGGTRAMWTQVASGDKNSAYGWIVNAGKPKKRGFKGKKITFINANGQIFKGTQQEFVRFSGTSIASASRICKHGAISVDGWKVEGSQKPPPARQNKGDFYELSKDGGQIKRLKRIDAALLLGVSPACFSSGAHYAQKNDKTYKGWRISKAN
jgi:hypothetical protein